MRIILVLLIALMGMSSGSPLGAAAQETTPTADATITETRTDQRYVLPYGSDGLHPDLTVTASERGVCAYQSLEAAARPDAWDCVSTDGQIYDPCFENPFAPIDEPGELACIESPFSNEVILFALEEPLTREKDAEFGDDDPLLGFDDDEFDAFDDIDPTPFDPWELPWALELANGEQCLLLPRIDLVLAGHSVHYECANGGLIVGELNSEAPLWTVSYLADGAIESTLVDVVIAWT